MEHTHIFHERRFYQDYRSDVTIVKQRKLDSSHLSYNNLFMYNIN